jgi:putative DNA-binding protein
MTREAPHWLADFQERFGDVIRTPLDRTSGTLAATTSAYDPRIVIDILDSPTGTGADRLAVYNRQYWFRLFDVVQRAFPLTSRLVGYWVFNDYVARYLRVRRPRGWDLDHVVDGFAAFVEDTFECDDPAKRCAWVEAARIDDAWRTVFRAPKIPPFRPSATHPRRLLDARLVASPAWRIVSEHRPLLELRKRLLHDSTQASVEMPPLLPQPRWSALVRRDHAILHISLEPREAELLLLLGETSVRDALARVERECAPEERALLPAQTRDWLARSVQLDFWSGVSSDG